MDKFLVSVVIPAFNEEASLERTLGAVRSALTDYDHEIWVVDDGSLDGTWQLLRRLQRSVPRLRGVRLARNFGHQAALLAGLAACRGEVIVMLDADGQHPPELVVEFLGRWREGADVVQGERRRTADTGWFKRLSSSVYYQLLSLLAGIEIRPGTSDFRLLSRRACDAVLASAGPRPFLRGLLPWLGLPTVFVAYDAPARRAGRSSYGLARMVRLSLDGILGFSVVPLRLAIGAGLAISALSFGYLVYVVLIRLFSGDAVPGWASTAGLLSLLGGIQIFTLGVVGEYLGRLFSAQLGRPLYVLSERLDATSPEPPA